MQNICKYLNSCFKYVIIIFFLLLLIYLSVYLVIFFIMRSESHLISSETRPFTLLIPFGDSTREQIYTLLPKWSSWFSCEMMRSRIRNRGALTRRWQSDSLGRYHRALSLWPLTSPVFRSLLLTPMRTTTGAMTTWTPWRPLPSTSWRRGWRSWTCSLWSWRKVACTGHWVTLSSFFSKCTHTH